MSNAQGYDLSHHNPPSEIDFHAESAGGLTFWGLKAAQGTGFTDPTFAAYRARVQTVNPSAVLIYFFYDPTADPKLQADHFCSVVAQLAENEFVAIDLESTPGWDTLPSEQSTANVLTWVSEVKADLGLKDSDFFLYGSLGWLRGQFGASLSQLAFMRLWGARYGVSDIGDVTPWPTWTVWQYSEYGGANKDLDLDQWNGQVAA